MNGTCYLLHFEPAYVHARHYLGWTNRDVAQRVSEHVRGLGSPLVKAAVQSGSNVRLVRTWQNVDRYYERALKNQHNGPRYCPLCKRKG